MKKSLFIIHLLGVLLLIVLISLVFQRSLVFVSDYLSLAFLVLFMLLPILFVYGAGQSLRFFKIALDNKAKDKEKRAAIRFFNGMAIYTLLSSLAIALSTLCFMFGNMVDLDTISPFIGVEVVTPLYALLISLGVYLPLKLSLENSLEE